MKAAPPIDLLDTIVVTDPERSAPLYAQVRSAIETIIGEHFQDGQQFWTELALVDRLNVSQITVRRALNDLAKDGKLVRRAAKGTFVRKPTESEAGAYRIAVFVPRHNSDILTNTIEQFASQAHVRRQRLDTHFVYEQETPTEAITALEYPPTEQRIVLLGLPPHLTYKMLEGLRNRGYRTVVVETTIATDGTEYVGFDDRVGVSIALRHLVELGHRRIAFLVNEPEASDEVALRLACFEQAASTGDFQGTVVNCGTRFWEKSHDAAYRAMPRVWTSGSKPSAILTVSDAGAWAALKWFSEQGVRVPDEVSVMGFDDDRLSVYTHPALTTLGRDRAELARKALCALDRATPTQSATLIAPYLIARASTAPARVMIGSGASSKEQIHATL